MNILKVNTYYNIEDTFELGKVSGSIQVDNLNNINIRIDILNEANFIGSAIYSKNINSDKASLSYNIADELMPTLNTYFNSLLDQITQYLTQN